MKLGYNKLTDYTVHFEALKRSDDDVEYSAYINTGKSGHGGTGRTPAEALFHAATHWLAYSNLPSDWRDPVWSDEPGSWHREVAKVVRSGWSFLNELQRQAIASACNEKANRP